MTQYEFDILKKVHNIVSTCNDKLSSLPSDMNFVPEIAFEVDTLLLTASLLGTTAKELLELINKHTCNSTGQVVPSEIESSSSSTNFSNVEI